MARLSQAKWWCNINRAWLSAVVFAIGFLMMEATQYAQEVSRKENPVMQDAGMTHRAKGSFEVKLNTQKPDNTPAASAGLGRMSIDKHFQGDLEATSAGEMLSILTSQGSGGYVAIERVTGKLRGKSGAFVLQHTSVMERGVPRMSVLVVPDSGTGEMEGISGVLVIQLVEGKHFYEFEYTLPAMPGPREP